MTAPQADLFGSIHLPALVRPSGAAAVAGRTAASGSRSQTGLVQPALQGAFARQRGAGVVTLEQDAEQSGSPAGVVAAPAEDLLAQGLASGARAGRRLAVGGEHGVGALSLQAVQQLPDSADGQVQGRGNGCR